MKILVLCSGGDAPGMNRFLYTFSRKNKNQIYYAKAGFKGLVENEIFALDKKAVEKSKNEAGCVIFSSRYPQFKEEKYFKKAVKNIQDFDLVVIMGGNGSEKGAKELFENGINTIFVPATIDNDVINSSYSIGFDTAVSQCVYTVQNTMPSIRAFRQALLLEVMGNETAFIAERVAKEVQADYLIKEKDDIAFTKISKIVKENYRNDKGTLIVVKEKVENVFEIEKELREKGIDARSQIVGRLQRGGKPTKFEIEMADRFAKSALLLLKEKIAGKRILVDGNNNFCVKDL